MLAGLLLVVVQLYPALVAAISLQAVPEDIPEREKFPLAFAVTSTPQTLTVAPEPFAAKDHETE